MSTTQPVNTPGTAKPAGPNIGRVKQVIGPTVDVEFRSDALPNMLNALKVRDEARGIDLTLEGIRHAVREVARQQGGDAAALGKLEQLVTWLPEHFELRDTAGVHQLYRLRPIEPLTLLARHYVHYLAKEAA